jgi:GNAT superfamily N-acetyltransferase
MHTPGSMIVPARVNELRRVLMDLSTDDIALLEPSLAAGIDRPLGREVLAATWPMTESVFVCLHNLEPSGLITIHRGTLSAQVRALAVSPDKRRKGLARTMLTYVEQRLLERTMHWLWLHIPSANTGATRSALALGFRRYRPQFLRRNHGRTIATPVYHLQLEPMSVSEAARAIPVWVGVEVTAGDEWVQPLIDEELLSWSMPEKGQTWLAVVDGNEVGCVHLHRRHARPCVWLWLDQTIWNTDVEMACLKGVLSVLPESPQALDVRLGSEGHLRAAVARYKEFGFVPVLEERVHFVKYIETKDDDAE